MNSDVWDKDEPIDDIIAHYKNLIFGIALTHTNNRSDAEDVFQEVFLIYFRKNLAFKDQEHQKAWLIRTTINCSKRITHSSWRKKVQLDSFPDQVFDFVSDTENSVFFALSQLPVKYKTAIYLFYYEEMSIEEISQYLKIKNGTIKAHLSRGRTMLRDLLKGEFFYE